jgi:NAD(P) transhydrogenase
VERYDLIVIGSGPAGEKGAAQAAYFGKRVALVEREPHVGGAGINTGTVPSKTLRETALYFSGLRQRGLYGVDYSVKPDLTVHDFMYREQEVVRSLREVVSANIAQHKIDLVRGQAVFDDPNTVRVGERRLHGDVILIATGSVPTRPAGVPFNDRRVHDSDEILMMTRLPRSLAVVGAGVIGCEYATIFAALGIRVTLVDGRERLLSFLDGEVAERLRTRMQSLGVDVRLRESVIHYDTDADGVRLDLKTGDALKTDAVLIAAGRVANVVGLGLERAGVVVNELGLLSVNDRYQTDVPHIYAAGDVIGFPALASTSMEQARVAMVHAFDLKYKTRVASILPYAIYTIPELATVGMTEEQCREKGIRSDVGRAFYRNNARGQIIGDTKGLVKLVFEAATLQLLGVHIVGENASELLHIGMIVMQYEGTINAFIDCVFNFPTVSEAYKYAAYDGLGNVARRRTLNGQEPSS